MIKEISNFVEKISEEYFTEGLVPSDGLHIWIRLDDDGKEIEKKVYRVKTISNNKKYINENQKECIYPHELVLREFYSGIISTNKSLDSPAKKIHSSSPFVIWFKKQNDKNIPELLKVYFTNTKKYFTNTHHNLIDIIRDYLSENIISLLKWSMGIFNEIKDDEYIKIYFDSDIDMVKQGYMAYLGSNLFNKASYNLENAEYGLSGFLNGDNMNKLFLMHKTKHYDSRYLVNNHISRKEAYNLHLLGKLLKNKQLPKPLPIFIDDEELNADVVRLHNREAGLGFHEIIHELIEHDKRDLTNYYLIFWGKNSKGKLLIHDLDFVPQFRFKLDGFYLTNYFLKDGYEGKIENVFHFESEIVQKVFSNVLIQKYEVKATKEKKILYKYFDDIEYNSKFMTKATHINVLKYRKAFYDFIYKSKSNAITSSLFSELMLTTVIDDIKHHNNKTGYNATDFNIKEKLNIYFSLNKNFGGEDMGSKIQPLQEKLKLLLHEPDIHIETDDEFAFDSGQLVYYILYQSEAANKTHALMEPYITKNDPALFKATVARGIDQYKHKFLFMKKSNFQKLASEVLGWETEIKIKDMLPLFLAGYFSNSLLFDSSK